MSFGPGSIALIVGAGLILFGPKKLPEFGKSLGETLREFKKATKGLVDEESKEEATVAKVEILDDQETTPTSKKMNQRTITIRSDQSKKQAIKQYKVISNKEEKAEK